MIPSVVVNISHVFTARTGPYLPPRNDSSGGLTYQHDPVYGYLMIPITPLGIFSSIVLLNALRRNARTLHTPANAFFVNMAVATLVLCGFVSPIHTSTAIFGHNSSLALKKTPNAQFCRSVSFLTMTCDSYMGYSYALIAWNRFVAVALTGKHHFLQSKLMTFLLIFGSWSCSVLVFVFPLFKLGGTFGFGMIVNRCVFSSVTSDAYKIFYKFYNSVLPFVIMVVCYSAAFIRLSASHRRLHQYAQNARVSPVFSPDLINQERARARRMKKEIKLTKVALAVCAPFFLTHFPNAVYGFSVKTIEELHSPLSQSLVYLTWLGSAVSPFLYAGMNSSSSRGIWSMLCSWPFIDDRVKKVRFSSPVDGSPPAVYTSSPTEVEMGRTGLKA